MMQMQQNQSQSQEQSQTQDVSQGQIQTQTWYFIKKNSLKKSDIKFKKSVLDMGVLG
jgi:hypothetical protein